MKKSIITIGLVLITLIVLLTQFGIQIGNVRIGKQLDLKVKQNYNFEKSNFYKEYYSKSDLIVLNLWATWCQPCIEEIPVLNTIKEDYKEEQIKFLSLSIDSDSLKLVNFNNTKKFKFNDITFANLQYRNAILNIIENKRADKWISSHSIPKTYLIKDKKVLFKFEGIIEDKELKEVINKYK